MRYLVFAFLLLLFGVGAFAAGLVPLPWVEPAKVAESEQPASASEKAALKSADTSDKGPDNKAHSNRPKTSHQGAPKSARAGTNEQQTASGQPSNERPANRLGVDVARLDPTGSSVIAGFAEPSSRVTVYADDKMVGTTTTDQNGEWLLISSGKIANTDAKITVKRGSDAAPSKSNVGLAGNTKQESKSTSTAATERQTDGASRKPTKTTAVAEASPPKSATVAKKAVAPRRTADDVEGEMIQRLRQLTKDAEKEKARAVARPTDRPQSVTRITQPVSPVAASPQTKIAYLPAPKKSTVDVSRGTAAPAAPALPLSLLNAPSVTPELRPTSGTKVAAATPTTAIDRAASTKPAKLAEALPVPVQYVFRKAEFTKDGREAANVLLEYLKAKGYKSVSLSGHADERGTSAANARLSKRRLERLERFLRAGGYQGELTLLPKGETEKYNGVDRSQFPMEELYQLDRRVEVVAAE